MYACIWHSKFSLRPKNTVFHIGHFQDKQQRNQSQTDNIPSHTLNGGEKEMTQIKAIQNVEECVNVR